MKLNFFAFLVSILLAIPLTGAEQAGQNEQNIINRYPDLVSLNSSIDFLSSQIAQKNTDLKNEKDDNEKAKIKAEITRLTQKLNSTKKVFANTVGNITLFSDEEDDSAKAKDRDVLKELQELLIPFIDSLKNATKRPRKIEKLRLDIEKLDSNISLAEKALQNISAVESMNQLSPMKDSVVNAKQMLERYIKENRALNNMYKNDLEVELKGKSSIFAVTDMVQEFFSRKGKNLLITICVVFLIIFIMRWLRKRILNMKYFTGDHLNIKKTFNALYGVIAGGAAVLAGITTLYLLNDWFLFSLAFLALIALIWSLKTYLPKFLAEIKILLNLGSVKEGQRIVWNNCPWIIKKLGMSIQLENKYLDSNVAILPIRDILNLYSRPLAMNEDLFPTRRGDFVMLSNGIFGEVRLQTPENIVISTSSTLKVWYTVKEYMDLKPVNYSNGFQIAITLPVNIKHQKEIFEIENILKEEFQEQAQSCDAFPEGSLRNIVIEYKESFIALDYLINLDFAGNAAPQYGKIKRAVNAILVGICNNHDITINPSK